MWTFRWPTCWRASRAAHAAGLSHIKVNMVVKRGTNDHEILPMARHFRGTGTTLRFIEYMDVGATNGWRMDEVLPSAELIERLRAELPWCRWSPAAPAKPPSAGAMPTPAASTTSLGEVGVISSVTQAFCHDCNRARPPPRASCTCACLPRKATTCARCCAAVPVMPTLPQPLRPSGSNALTAIRTAQHPARRQHAGARAAWR